jgi:hypothetical protein
VPDGPEQAGSSRIDPAAAVGCVVTDHARLSDG